MLLEKGKKKINIISIKLKSWIYIFFYIVKKKLEVKVYI